MRRNFVLVGVIVMASCCFSACSSFSSKEQSVEKFQNTEIEYKTSFANVWQIMKAYWQDSREEAQPLQNIPMQKLSIDELQKSDADIAVRIGHSSVLLRLDGDYVLLDPVFSERASMVQWLGPKRFHPAPISIAELPPIKAVVISHDHYDHLDKLSIKELAAKTDVFVTPLRVGKHLRDWGVAEHQIVELDWGQNFKIEQLELIATPSQHFSGRGLLDRDHTLWASWVIKGWDSKVFYTGDSGYFSGFKEIGEKYGPFDLTLVETGAYNEHWAEIHMMPEQSLQAHIDLKGKVMMPVHNGTFDLALHNWYEPLQNIKELAEKMTSNCLRRYLAKWLKLKTPRLPTLGGKRVSQNSLF